MNHSRIDYINIGLMLISCLLAFILPFEMFLFSYAVIGPLHYLTEISWLKQKDYFATGKNDYWFLIVLCGLVSLGVIFHDLFVARGLFPNTFSPETIDAILKIYRDWYISFILAAFVGSIGLIFLKNNLSKWILFLVAIIIGYYLNSSNFYLVWIGVFVPTLVHVFLFTGLFILYGAFKSNTTSGYLSLLVFLGCTLSFFIIRYVPEGFQVSAYVKDAFTRTGFVTVNSSAVGLFKSGGITEFDVFGSKRGLMIQRFIAFAYTYHYLNWFSKTEIIKWHLVPKKWLISSAVVWILSVLLYLYDYRTGLIALFFLSMLHVFLEFPLNGRTVVGIFEEINKKFFSGNKGVRRKV